MSSFGDDDPEDGYDDHDPALDKFEILVRVTVSILLERLSGSTPRLESRRYWALATIGKLRLTKKITPAGLDALEHLLRQAGP